MHRPLAAALVGEVLLRGGFPFGGVKRRRKLTEACSCQGTESPFRRRDVIDTRWHIHTYLDWIRPEYLSYMCRARRPCFVLMLGLDRGRTRQDNTRQDVYLIPRRRHTFEHTACRRLSGLDHGYSVVPNLWTTTHTLVVHTTTTYIPRYWPGSPGSYTLSTIHAGGTAFRLQAAPPVFDLEEGQAFIGGLAPELKQAEVCCV